MALEHVIETDRALLKRIRVALDALTAVFWDDVQRQQTHATDRRNAIASLALDRYGAFRGLIFLVLVIVAIALPMAIGAIGVPLALIVYAIFALFNFTAARVSSSALVKQSRAHLADDGKDTRFVTFVRFDRDLAHPLVGFDGPAADGTLNSRAWKIPYLRQEEALAEVFFEAMGEDGTPALLSRFPGKSPMHVFADPANEFIASFGSYLLKAVERHLRPLFSDAKAFRGAVMRFAQLDAVQTRIVELEMDIAEFDRSRRLWETIELSPEVKEAIARGIARFRTDESLPQQALLLAGPAEQSKRDLAQTIARLAGAIFIPLFANGAPLPEGPDLLRRIQDVFADARRARSLIFIDDARGNLAAIAPLLVADWDTQINGRRPWIVAALDTDTDLSATLRARFGTVVQVPNAEPELILPEETLAELRALRANAMQPILLCGPHGSGKSSIARALANERDLTYINGADLGSADTAEPFARAVASAPSLLLLPSIDASDAERTRQLSSALDDLRARGAHVVVVATALDPSSIEMKLRAHFESVIALPLPDCDARIQLLQRLLRGKRTDFESESGARELAEHTDGRSAGDLRSFVDQAMQRATMRALASADPTATTLQLADFTLS